jgi:hypothetical protein
MKVGIIGLDTSHAVVFSDMLNDAANQYHIAGPQVVSAYPGGSAAFHLSTNRVQGYTQDLQTRLGVVMRDSIAQVANEVDAILLESVDGRQHLQQFREAAIGKPVFIDKPLATSTADARAILEIAQATKTPIMSSSSLRYDAGIAGLNTVNAAVESCDAFGPAPIFDDYPGLFWYGIHSAEMLFMFLGKECRKVRCLPYAKMDVAVGEWSGDRLGVMRGTRFEKYEFGCMIHTPGGARLGMATSRPPSYFPLLQQIVGFFETGVSAVPLEETFAIVSFLAAADKSKALSGASVDLETL